VDLYFDDRKVLRYLQRLLYEPEPGARYQMAWFPWVDNATGSSGSLVCHEQHYTPSENGTLVYFNSPSGNLSTELERVEAAGGKILQPRTQISEEHGYMALLTDIWARRSGRR